METCQQPLFFVFSRSHALRGNAVKGALRRELRWFPSSCLGTSEKIA